MFNFYVAIVKSNDFKVGIMLSDFGFKNLMLI